MLNLCYRHLIPTVCIYRIGLANDERCCLEHHLPLFMFVSVLTIILSIFYSPFSPFSQQVRVLRAARNAGG